MFLNLIIFCFLILFWICILLLKLTIDANFQQKYNSHCGLKLSSGENFLTQVAFGLGQKDKLTENQPNVGLKFFYNLNLIFTCNYINSTWYF